MWTRAQVSAVSGSRQPVQVAGTGNRSVCSRLKSRTLTTTILHIHRSQITERLALYNCSIVAKWSKLYTSYSQRRPHPLKTIETCLLLACYVDRSHRKTSTSVLGHFGLSHFGLYSRTEVNEQFSRTVEEMFVILSCDIIHDRITGWPHSSIVSAQWLIIMIIITINVRFYRAMHFSAKRGIAIACRLSVCPSVCLSVTLVNCDHIGWNSSKIISQLVSRGRSLFATPTWRVSSKGNTPKFSPE